MEFRDRDISISCAGDWLGVKAVADRPSRRGLITEPVGAPGHNHFGLRCDERYESIIYPVFEMLCGRSSQRHCDRGS